MTACPLVLLVFLVALVYSSVGHGGASGYLAVMAMMGWHHAQISTAALALNVIVAGTATAIFWQAGYGSRRLLWPFLATSIPAAFVGGWLPVSAAVFRACLAAVLGVAAIRLWLTATGTMSSSVRCQAPHVPLALGAGAGIGLLSGIVGVGGGIFLSPLMILCGWAQAKQTAAASAAFIVANSVAGLAGRLAAGHVQLGTSLPLVAAALAGGVAGAGVGANRLPQPALCRVLAGVLLVAVAKWVVR